MSFKAYEEYKNAHMDWLDELPDHWYKSSMRWISKIYSGGTPDKKNQSYWANGSIPWLNSGSVNHGLISQPSAMITLDAFKASSAKWIPKNSLVLALAGQGKTKGTVAQVSFQTTCNQSMAAIIPQGNIGERYLYWWLTSNYQNIRNLAGGDLRDGLNLDMLGGIDCPLPHYKEQTIIAAFLDHETARIDALIEEQQRLIALLKEKRQAVISHAVTKGLDPNVPMKDSGVEWLGEVPAHWEIIKISRLYTSTSDSGDTDLPILQVSIHHGVSNKELSEEESDRKITRILDKEKYRKVKPGDLVYNMMRAWQGGFGAVTVNGLVSPAYVVCRPKTEQLTPYIEKLLRTPNAIEQMRTRSYGITDFRLRLYWDEFKTMEIALPPIEERVKIVGMLEELVLSTSRLEKSAAELIKLFQERRSALISAAVTGKIDVRDWQPPTSQAVAEPAEASA